MNTNGLKLQTLPVLGTSYAIATLAPAVCCLIFLFSLSVGTIYGQDNYKRGYIITNGVEEYSEQDLGPWRMNMEIFGAVGLEYALNNKRSLFISAGCDAATPKYLPQLKLGFTF